MRFVKPFVKFLKSVSLIVCLSALLFACSLPPDVPVTKEKLDGTGLYQRFVIEENPETLIFVLNKHGEAVVKGMYRNIPVYIKIMATSKGIVWYVYPRER